MAVAVKNTPEVGARRGALDRLGVASLLGTAYALGSIGIVFYLLPSLWWSAWPRTFGANLLLGLVMLAAAVGLIAVGGRLFHTARQGVRAGVFVGLVGFLVVLLLARWVSLWVEYWSFEARLFNETTGAVVSAVVGVLLLAGGIRLMLRPRTERFLSALEAQGWFSARSFKPLQGVRVRRGTIFGILLLVGSGIYTLISHNALRRGSPDWYLNIPFTGHVTVTDPGDVRTKLDEQFGQGRQFDYYFDPATQVKVDSPGDAAQWHHDQYVGRAEFDAAVRNLTKEGKQPPTAEPPNLLVVDRYTLRDINDEVNPATHFRIESQGDSPWAPGTIVTKGEFDTEIQKLKAEERDLPLSRATQPAGGPLAFETLTLLPSVAITVPLLLSALALWLAWRIVNLPVFADFLIATEAEMNKVSWTTQRRLVQDTIVVLVTVVLMAAFLFVTDQVWRVVLSWKPIGVLQIPEEKPETNANIEQRPF